MSKSNLYIISDQNGCYKIGITNNAPNKRLKQLQTGNPKNLKIVSCYSVNSKLIRKLESEIHSQLSYKFPKRGEWFAVPLEYIVIRIVEEIIEELFPNKDYLIIPTDLYGS